MQDFEAFQRALASHGRDQNGEPTYMNSLMSSMCLVLDEFYSHLRVSISGVCVLYGLTEMLMVSREFLWVSGSWSERDDRSRNEGIL